MTKKFNILLAVCLALAATYQFAFHASETNIYCVLIAAGACVGTAFLVSRERNYRQRPLSTLSVMWFPLTGLLIPLVSTGLDGNPLIYKLKLPLPTFAAAAVVSVTIAFAYLLFVNLKILRKPQEIIRERVFERLPVFTPPTIFQLWLFGLVGSLASVALLVFLEKVDREVAGFLPQIVQTLRPFAYAPFILPFLGLFGSSVKPSRMQYLLLVPYIFLTIGIAMLANSRSVFAIPILTVLLAGLFMILTGRVSSKFLSWPRIVTMLIVAFVGASELTDVSSAMRVARLKRGTVDRSEITRETFELFFDKQRLRDYWKSARATGGAAGAWDEDYLQNEFLHRISSLKFIDLCLYFTQNFGEAERQRLRRFSDDRIVCSLPDPVIRFFGLPVNKYRVINMSYGDFLYGARSVTFASFRTGSFVVVDRLIHGLWFYPVLVLNVILYFFVVDCFTRPEKTKTPGVAPKQPVRVVFAPLSVIFAFAFIQSFYQESLATTLLFYIRALPQMIIIYLILFQLTRMLSRFIPRFGERVVMRPRRIMPTVAN